MSDQVNWDAILVTAISGTDPAIEVAPDGAGYEVTVPAGRRAIVQVAAITLVASADAANRVMFLNFVTSAGSVKWISTAGLTVTAGQTKTQTWCKNSLVVTAGTQYGMHMPDIELSAGDKIYVYCALFDTVAPGDNCSALTVYWKVTDA